MIIQLLRRTHERLGKFYLPLVLVLFFVAFNGLLYTNVRQKVVNYKEGQVASESIRANKTVENTAATEQKKQLAAEAVTPEYTYQEDIAKHQHDVVNHLFELMAQVNQETKDAKNEENSKVSTAEQIAALKKKFEKIDADDLNFYQQLNTTFFENAFSLTNDELSSVKKHSLALIDEQMNQQIRQSDLSMARQSADNQVQFLNVNAQQGRVIRYIVKQGIVTNTFLNEKRTAELKKASRDAVQPVMIYQGEVIIREGNQIDGNALEKLKLLGLTNQNTSIFPLVAMVSATLLQIFVLLYFLRELPSREKRLNLATFYVIAMLGSTIGMQFFQFFQTETVPYIPLFFPAAFVPLMLTMFGSRRLGIIAALFQVITALFVFYNAIGTNMLTVILVTYLFAGLMGTLLKKGRLAEQGFSAATWLVLFPTLLVGIFVVFQGMTFADSRTWTMIACGFAGTVLSVLLTVGLYQYIELLVTDDSVLVLNELSNPNHPLLKRLLEEAPGTYHHSMMVANLSANAVAEIGGQSLLTRVACYYHDIGKLKHANFFVENLPAGAENPHNFLLPEDSKQIIFGHVLDGAKTLEEENMPQMVIDVCRQHHGTTLMKYFFVKAQERKPEVTEEDFRYPGPKPQTKEAAVVSIADSCEAAVRAMENPTNEKIKAFVSNLIKDRILDGQLDDSGLTMKEIRIIEKSLVNGLCSTFHSRIKYPKMKNEAEAMKEEQERRDD